MRKFAFFHSFLFIVIAFLSKDPWPYLLLTVAQLVYVPIALKMVMNKSDWFSKYYSFFSIPAYVSIAILQTTTPTFPALFAFIYFAFTVCIALYGLTRFLNRGFSNCEEFAIDLGMMYIALGGGWYFAYIAGIDTGFTPLITWLTGIHFHYSAFLLPIFIGLVGRLYKPRSYRFFSTLLLVAPMIVAIGITFSRWIELFAVLLYIVGLAGMIGIAWRARYTSRMQKWLLVTSFTSLGVTIIFSLLYVLGNGFGLTSITIDFMLRFHGVLNCIVFALLGIIGWSLTIPHSNVHRPSFSVSRIRGKQSVTKLAVAGEQRGLVDAMDIYNVDIAPTIADFYENTTDYRLFATVRWKKWFKPFAFIYSFISRKTEQINLPLHANEIEMTGAIVSVDEMDGRISPRAWIRKIEDELTFIAIYSYHEKSDGQVFMNIALPLPFSTMTGILEVCAVGEHLQLTSKKSDVASDAGIYLSSKWGEYSKLPIEEDFIVKEGKEGQLVATHKMWLFSLPFLTIEYTIQKK
ncbi:YndJ family protein [Sporosarcina sp. OR05]|uniref:YndJ family protein n=1 Tax=Sporosarcina sp. OR05 TaxID=2969819 RepID=UPI00352B8797